jgi:hypothetical protein
MKVGHCDTNIDCNEDDLMLTGSTDAASLI